MPSLYIVRGLEPGRRFELTREVTICGRNPTCDIPVPSISVSRQHFRIIRHGDRFTIEDMDTPPGTRVNDQQIRGATQLSDGDRIRIADFEAVFESGGTEGSVRKTTGRLGDPDGEGHT
jgi:pSer/pThr/pTyr-binding forkhead associated (FHA) protein